MRPSVFAPPDAALAGILLGVLILGSLPGFVGGEDDSGFVVRAGGDDQWRFVGETALPPTGRRVNLNRADARQLATVPGMTVALAEAVVRFRNRHGPFGRLSDLEAVRGVGPKRLQKMLPYLVLGEEGTWRTR